MASNSWPSMYLKQAYSNLIHYGFHILPKQEVKSFNILHWSQSAPLRGTDPLFLVSVENPGRKHRMREGGLVISLKQRRDVPYIFLPYNSFIKCFSLN